MIKSCRLFEIWTKKKAFITLTLAETHHRQIEGVWQRQIIGCPKIE